MRALCALALALSATAAFVASPPRPTFGRTRAVSHAAAATSAAPTPIITRHRRLLAPIAASAAAAAAHAHDHDEHNGQFKVRKASFAALALVVREWLARARRLVVDFLSGIFGGTKAASPPTIVLPHSATISINNLIVTEGVVTRDVPEPDPVLAYFNYRFSPFYATLPDDAQPQVSASAAPTNATLRWLTHRHAQPPTEAEVEADRARLRLLRQLYDEACAEEGGSSSSSSSSPGGWFQSLFS